MKKSILFIDHIFHKKTKSSQFFIEILEREYVVNCAYVTNEFISVEKIKESAINHNLIIVWQLDYLAPILEQTGIPIIVVPMYDGSALMPDEHWILSRNCKFINFSKTIHDRIERNKNLSLLLKYYLPPVESSKRVNFDNGINVFLWERKPEDGISLQLALKFFGNVLNKIHIHECPDDDKYYEKHYHQVIRDKRLRKSKWLNSKCDYLNILKSHNVFIAPRLSEGIGLPMLEALAQGMVVIANDLPVHTEYILNWVNGILFNDNTNGQIETSNLASISDISYNSAVEGYTNWLVQKQKILPFITHDETIQTSINRISIDIQKELFYSYQAGINNYCKFLYNLKHRFPELLNIRNSANLVEDRSRNIDIKAIHDHVIQPDKYSLISIDNEISFNDQNSRKYLGEGWGDVESTCSWIIGKTASIHFAGHETSNNYNYLILSIRTLKEFNKTISLSVQINTKVVALITIDSNWREYQIILPDSVFKKFNEISFLASDARKPINDNRELSVAFRKLTII